MASTDPCYPHHLPTHGEELNTARGERHGSNVDKFITAPSGSPWVPMRSKALVSVPLRASHHPTYPIGPHLTFPTIRYPLLLPLDSECTTPSKNCWRAARPLSKRTSSCWPDWCPRGIPPLASIKVLRPSPDQVGERFLVPTTQLQWVRQVQGVLGREIHLGPKPFRVMPTHHLLGSWICRPKLHLQPFSVFEPRVPICLPIVDCVSYVLVLFLCVLGRSGTHWPKREQTCFIWNPVKARIGPKQPNAYADTIRTPSAVSRGEIGFGGAFFFLPV